MTTYYSHGVSLSEGQRQKLANSKTLLAYKRRVIPRRHCVEVTACKFLRGQESYLRILNVFLLAKNITHWKNKSKVLFQNLLFLKRTL